MGAPKSAGLVAVREGSVEFTRRHERRIELAVEHFGSRIPAHLILNDMLTGTKAISGENEARGEQTRSRADSESQVIPSVFSSEMVLSA